MMEASDQVERPMPQSEALPTRSYPLAVLADKERALKKAFNERLVYYKSQHRTVGCKVTHMFGVPMIAVSVLAFPFNKKISILLQVLGWTLQLIGHYVYEHNSPVLLRLPQPHLTVIAALEFVREEWQRFLEGAQL